MTSLKSSFAVTADNYLKALQACFSPGIINSVESLAKELREAWIYGRNVYLCGNGGSASNAMHIANDFHYGIGACGPGSKTNGLRVEALPSNSSIITCLANDISYDDIYSHQLEVKGRPGDLLIILSGSGNSPNVVKALQTASALEMRSFAILGFSGGRCLELADFPIHFAVDDMQLAEDTQLIVGHLCMKWLAANKP